MEDYGVFECLILVELLHFDLYLYLLFMALFFGLFHLNYFVAFLLQFLCVLSYLDHIWPDGCVLSSPQKKKKGFSHHLLFHMPAEFCSSQNISGTSKQNSVASFSLTTVQVLVLWTCFTT